MIFCHFSNRRDLDQYWVKIDGKEWEKGWRKVWVTGLDFKVLIDFFGKAKKGLHIYDGFCYLKEKF